MVRWLAVLLAAGTWCAAGTPDDMTWQRRSLRAAPPKGYIAVVRLAGPRGAEARGALVCESDGVELRCEGGRWRVTADGTAAGEGALPSGGPQGFFVKRTPGSLMIGVGAQWVYGRDMGAPQGKPAVRVGVAAGCKVAAFRLVAREPVRFADDFPDPEPKTGLWAPTRGQWALSSLSFPEQSANPAELAAVFDEIEDVASRGRTREQYVGIGVRLQGGRQPRVLRLAGNSPAERAGIRQNDVILKVDGVEVNNVAEAMGLLQGKEGEPVKIAFSHGGVVREVEVTREVVVWGKTRRQVPIQPYRPDGEALITVGFDYWTDYRFATAVQTRQVGGFGLVFAYLGPADYHVFRWLSAEKTLRGFGRWQLVRVRGGQAEAVAEKEGGFLPHDFYAMSIAVGGDKPGDVRVACFVDSMKVFEAADDAMVPGRIGFWAEAPGAVCFDDVVVGGDEHQEAQARGTANPVQRRDPVMRAWADAAYSWQYVGLGQQWWHKSDFPGDVSMTAPVAGGDRVVLVVAGERGKERSGYGFELLEGTKGGRLTRAGKVVAEKPLGGDRPKQITLSRQGRQVRALLDGKAWLAYDDPKPLGGSAVHVRGALVRDVQVECPNVVQYYFNRAPTEWHVMHGYWEVMNRWVCDPRWSFFGGRGDDALAVWSKRRLDGDCFLDVHAGVMMFERSGRYENMRDIGLTICGDGRNLASGYSVIVGAEGNQATALFRNGTLVAHTRDRSALLPGRSRRRGEQLYSQHRGWVHMKLTRQGQAVRFYVWDEMVLEHRDPNPLPGGHCGIWSVENGLLLGNVRLAASRVGEPKPFLRRSRPFADMALTNDRGEGQVRVVARDGSYEITNAVGGGSFGVALRPRVFSAAERPSLAFDVKLTPDAMVDLYLRCHGKLYRVMLSGPPDGPCLGETLGTFGGVKADGQWHRVSFGLLDALRARHPDDKLLMVWEPELANYSNRHYLLAGFGGNGAGATYWLRNIALAPATQQQAAAQ